MTLAKIVDGAITEHPVPYSELRKRFPSTSFPKNINDADLTSFGYVSVVNTVPPSFNSETEQLTETTPTLVNGVWVQQWLKTDLTNEEQAAIAAAAQEQKVVNARSLRNSKLLETDYLALSDATLTDEMRTYRQALRDVPAQAGFPDNITWPTKPS